MNTEQTKRWIIDLRTKSARIYRQDPEHDRRARLVYELARRSMSPSEFLNYLAEEMEIACAEGTGCTLCVRGITRIKREFEEMMMERAPGCLVH